MPSAIATRVISEAGALPMISERIASVTVMTSKRPTRPR